MTICTPGTPEHYQRQLVPHIRKLVERLPAGKMPFLGDDSSVGMEYELQVAVAGDGRDVDLPITISNSSYCRNLIKRCGRGDQDPKSLAALQEFFTENAEKIWENSWVRLRQGRLGDQAKALLAADLQADKSLPDGQQRTDRERFFCQHNGREHLRIPVSYLLKLALADAIDTALPTPVVSTGRRLLHNFQSDNTSPEILSLTIPRATKGGLGLAAAKEAATTFLVCQLLIQYANSRFGLLESGQRCLLYNAPQAPQRQKQLNELVPDSYYRQLFISPCLSGWDRGEEKQRYMAMCHQTLSRSQLNALYKLRDAGIVSNNLVVLPNTSNTCLANNGTHVTLGSSLLTTLAADPVAGFSGELEKFCGDLVIKIVEHFLPLFVNTYTAAPYRIDFADFHPERILGFLPHELDYTHLRMLWRRWQKKADNRAFGRPLTPFGPRRFDRLLATLLRLRGDLVPDFRLLDYLVTLLSTDNCPALDGTPGNQERLKQELTEMGIFDHRLATYLPYRLRSYATMGFSGFEGRSYSLFPSFMEDMAEAVELQNLLTGLAYRLVLTGKVSHADIPDLPAIESERRQLFFAAAMGIPTCYVRTDTHNRFLQRILNLSGGQRHSRRYRGYTRITVHDYRLALVDLLERDGRDLLEDHNQQDLLERLRERLQHEAASAWHRLAHEAVNPFGRCNNLLKIPADEFNHATEHYYRTELKTRHTREGLQVLREECQRLAASGEPSLLQLQQTLLPAGCSADSFIAGLERDVLQERLDSGTLRILLALALCTVASQQQANGD